MAKGKLVLVKKKLVPKRKTYMVADRAVGFAPIKIKRKGALRRHGYNIDDDALTRQRALRSAVRQFKPGTVWRMLNAQWVYRSKTVKRGRQKLRVPKSEAKRDALRFKADRDWMAKQWGGPTPWKAIKKWKSMSPRERARRMPGRRGKGSTKKRGRRPGR